MQAPLTLWHSLTSQAMTIHTMLQYLNGNNSRGAPQAAYISAGPEYLPAGHTLHTLVPKNQPVIITARLPFCQALRWPKAGATIGRTNCPAKLLIRHHLQR